jgi:tetratricopeptide (TPR) repeat protein
VVDRIYYLRRLGREEDALAVARPHLRDVRVTAGNGEHGMWVLNEAAFALAALGRRDEALALMERIATLPLADNPGLISMRINHLELLWDAGRHEEVLRRAAALDPGIENYANDYGQMWIASSRVCALASLGRRAETTELLARLVALRDTNGPALSRAYLCLGDDAAAAALLVHRLESDDPHSVILALQDYALTGPPAAAQQPTRALSTRLLALRERPEVRAAFDRVGRNLSPPLARSYWGDF